MLFITSVVCATEVSNQRSISIEDIENTVLSPTEMQSFMHCIDKELIVEKYAYVPRLFYFFFDSDGQLLREFQGQQEYLELFAQGILPSTLVDKVVEQPPAYISLSFTVVLSGHLQYTLNKEANGYLTSLTINQKKYIDEALNQDGCPVDYFFEMIERLKSQDYYQFFSANGESLPFQSDTFIQNPPSRIIRKNGRVYYQSWLIFHYDEKNKVYRKLFNPRVGKPAENSHLPSPPLSRSEMTALIRDTPTSYTYFLDDKKCAIKISNLDAITDAPPAYIVLNRYGNHAELFYIKNYACFRYDHQSQTYQQLDFTSSEARSNWMEEHHHLSDDSRNRPPALIIHQLL